jgi:hypothetical protein
MEGEPMGLLNKLLGGAEGWRESKLLGGAEGWRESKLLGGAEGCRESMRGAYERRANAAREKHMESPHLVGLYGALGSRYQARGLVVDEAVMWSELAPFLAMEPAMSIAALAEYAAYQEQQPGVRREWLGSVINRALQARKASTMTETVVLGLANRVAWCELLEPATVAALEGEAQTEGTSAAQAHQQAELAAKRQLASRILAPETPRRDELEDWIRRHPKPKPAYEQRWRKSVVMLSTSLPNTKEPNHDQLKRDQRMLESVSDDYPMGGGLGNFRPQVKEATKNWTRLSKKYLGIEVS